MSATLNYWRLTQLNRFHSNHNPRLRDAKDRLDGHIGRMCALADKIWPEDHALKTAITRHDLGEAGIGPGDVSGLWKKRNPDKAAILAQWEAEARIENGVPDFPHDPRVHILDRMDAYIFASENAPEELQRNDWRETRQEIVTLAQHLDQPECDAICDAILEATHHA